MISCRLEKDTNTVGLWHFTEGVGTQAKDYSGNASHGTLVGGVSWQNDILGKAVRIDGSAGGSSYISCGNIPSFNVATADFTIELVINNIVEQGGWAWLVKKMTSAYGNGLYMALTGGRFRVSLGTWFTDALYNTDDVGGWTLNIAKPHYLVLTRKAGMCYAFVDGLPYGTGVANTYNFNNVSTAILEFGKHGDAGNASLLGSLLIARFSNIARSAAEIKHNWLRMPQILTA